MQPREFLEAVFGDPPKGASIVVWGLQDKSSRWCDSIETAAKAIDAAKTGDVYVGVSLQSLPAALLEARRREEIKARQATPPRTPRKLISRMTRGFNETAVALTGLFVDIDVEAGAGHKQANLPPDVAAAMRIVEKLPIRPTLVVDSGGGLHVWYLFKEPFVFENEGDRLRAYTLSIALQKTYQRIAKAQGYAIDSTFDLTRVLRVPGTLNRKYTPPRQCDATLVDLAARYDPGDVEAALDPEDLRAAEERAGKTPAGSAPAGPTLADAAAAAPIGPVAEPGKPAAGSLVYSAAATVDSDLIESLAANDPKFLKTWNRQRKDLKDQSPSGYDLALAHIGAAAGLDDQTILNLLIAHRRKHKSDLKLHRADYYEKFTIAAVRRSREKASAVDRAAVLVNESNSPDSPAKPATPEDRVTALDTVSHAIGTRIRKVIRYVQDPPKFRLVTSRGAIELGTVDNLIGQAAFRNAIAAAEKKLIPTFKADAWNNLAQLLLNACEDVDTGEEATDRGAAASWLARYLDENPPGEISEQLVANQSPFVKPDIPARVFIFGSGLREWLLRREQEKISSRQLGVFLRLIGGEPRSESVKLEDGRDTTRHVWIVPLPTRHLRAGMNGTPKKTD
jgi:hypothetical protein